MYDIIIAGAGPAGLSAAIYASRAGYKTLVLESEFVGGQIARTHNMENYLGFENGISGADFAEASRKQAQRFGAEICTEGITEFDLKNKTIKTSKNQYQAKAIILAMGAKPRKLGLEKENEFEGAGISYCATCDGAFFKKRDVVVIGGGDTALEDAVYLSAIANKVYVVHRRDEFRAAEILVERARKRGNIEFILNATPEKLLGDFGLEGVTLKNKLTGELFDVKADGCFVAIGNIPQTQLLREQVSLDENGYIIAGEDTKTNIDGIFAVGDIRTKHVRQVITAAADGAVAVQYITEYLRLTL